MSATGNSTPHTVEHCSNSSEESPGKMYLGLGSSSAQRTLIIPASPSSFNFRSSQTDAKPWACSGKLNRPWHDRKSDENATLDRHRTQLLVHRGSVGKLRRSTMRHRHESKSSRGEHSHGFHGTELTKVSPVYVRHFWDSLKNDSLGPIEPTGSRQRTGQPGR
jgi:hypothetical protein